MNLELWTPKIATAREDTKPIPKKTKKALKHFELRNINLN